MTGNNAKFGLTLPNRGVVIGATTVDEMLQLAAINGLATLRRGAKLGRATYLS